MCIIVIRKSLDVHGLRKESKEIRDYWKAQAKEKVAANKLARSLHEASGNESECEEVAESVAEKPVSPGIALTWMGLPLTIQRLISQGTYGQVYEVKTADGLLMAAKVLKDYHSDAPAIQDDIDNLKDLSKEISIHHRFCASPYVLRALGVASVSLQSRALETTCLLTELADMTIFDALQREADAEISLTFEDKLRWCAQIAAGLCHLHGQRVIHLDMKLDNCFLIQRSQGDGKLTAAIGDFGVARQADGQGQVVVCTNQVYAARYRPPEVTSLRTLDPR